VRSDSRKDYTPGIRGRLLRGRMRDSVLNEWRVTMPLPNISAAQIEWLIQRCARMIQLVAGKLGQIWR
jgi:hypothetical protein